MNFSRHVLLFEGKPPDPKFPPASWIAPPHAWAPVRTPSVDPMAIKARGWCDNSYIWFAHDERFSDDEYRMKIMDGGMLLLQEQTKGGGFLRVAPRAWTRVKTPSVDPLAIKASGWCDSFYIPLVDDHAPGSSSCCGQESGYRMKIMDGGLLLFQEKTEGGGFGGFVIVAPHAWKFVKGPFDFTR